jgi:hypothetical protein
MNMRSRPGVFHRLVVGLVVFTLILPSGWILLPGTAAAAGAPGGGRQQTEPVAGEDDLVPPEPADQAVPAPIARPVWEGVESYPQYTPVLEPMAEPAVAVLPPLPEEAVGEEEVAAAWVDMEAGKGGVVVGAAVATLSPVGGKPA